MEHIIYTTSPLNAFKFIIMILFFNLILIVVFFVLVLSKSKSKTRSRSIQSLLIGVVVLLSFCFLSTAIRNLSLFLGDPKTLVVVPISKNSEEHSSTHKGKSSVSYSYYIKTADSVSFSVDASAYNQIVIGGCYQFTFYDPSESQAIFFRITERDISRITEIRQLDLQHCKSAP